MGLYDKITLSQARKDLKYIQDTYGMPQDFCGSFCNTRTLNKILMGEINIKETVIDIILYYFNNGLEDENSRSCFSNKYPDINDKRVKRIVDRYNIVVEQ